MRKVTVPDKAVVVILTKSDAKAVLYRLQNRNGVKQTKAEQRAEDRLLLALELVGAK